MNNLNSIRDKLTPVFQKHHTKRAVVFGSYAKGTNTPHSDVDIYVDSQLRGLKFIGLTEDIRQALNNQEVDVFDVSHIETDSLLSREIQNTGVIIYG